MSQTLPSQGWYVGRGGPPEGPYTLADLQGLAQSGGLQPGNLVWCQGMPQWQPVEIVLPQLVAGVAQQPPPPPAGWNVQPQQQQSGFSWRNLFRSNRSPMHARALGAGAGVSAGNSLDATPADASLDQPSRDTGGVADTSNDSSESSTSSDTSSSSSDSGSSGGSDGGSSSSSDN